MKELIRDKTARDALRVGDVFNTIFEYFCKTGDYERAGEILDEMHQGNYQVNKYLDKALVRVG
jgi:pentatricopeptide repeat protein